MKTKDLTFSAMLIALGVVLPIVTHTIAAGPVLLPMHIPVIIAGFVLKPKNALLVGVLTPILSSVLTKMPPIYPILPMMVVELGTYGLVTSIIVNKYDINIWLTLIISMVAGRVAAMIVVFVLVTIFDAQMGNAFLFAINSIKTGTIGIIIQLIIIPPIIVLVKKD